MRIRFRSALAVLTATLIGLVPRAASGITVNSRSTGVQSPSDPVAFDIDADNNYELILTTSNGTIAVYDSRTLKPIWRQKVADKALTQPAIGNFTGTGAYTMVVGSLDGSVYFLRAGTGDLISTIKIGTGITAAPTVAPLVAYDKSDRDGAIICDDSGAIHLIGVKDEKAQVEFNVPNTFQGFTVGRIKSPASVGDITGDEIPEIVVGSVSGTVQAFSINETSKRYLWHAPQGTAINTPVSIGDLMRGGKNNLIFGTSAGNLIVLMFEPRGTNIFFRTVQELRLLAPATGHVLLTDIDNDGYLDAVAMSANAVSTFDGAAQLSGFGLPFTTPSPPLGGLGIVRLKDGTPHLVFGDGQGTLNLLDATLAKQEPVREKTDRLPEFCPVGNLTGSGKVEVAYLSNDRSKLQVAQLADAGENNHPTLAVGANYARDGQLTSESATRLAQARQKFEAGFDVVIAKAEQLRKDGKHAEALAAAEEAVGMRPGSKAARALQSSISRRVHWFRNTLAVLAALAAIAGAAFLIITRRRKKALLDHSDASFHRGDYGTAIREYKSILARDPKNPRVTLSLANAYLQSGDVPMEAADVMKAARQLKPDSGEFTIALARAYANAGLETDEALDAYLVAIATLEQDRGKIAFHTGNILRKRKELDQAFRYYKMATKEGYAEPPVYDALASLFIETSQYSEKTLGVFESVAKRRGNEPEILEALCRAYLAARRSDDKACKVSRALIELRPDAPAGVRLLSRCEILAGNPAAAAELGEKIVRQSPNDQETLTLLSHAYIALGRTDKAAIEIYRRALDISPDEPSLLRQLALALLSNNSESDGDVDVIKRASTANPQDLDLLKGLAEIGRKREDYALTISSLEAATALGYREADAYVPLAEAYLNQKQYGGKAEVAFREALRAKPEDARLEAALAMALVSSGRTDAETMIQLEKVFTAGNADVAIGKHLSRAYLENVRFDDATKIIRYLLQHHPNDEDLQRLFAKASLQSNRLDEAIRQYEFIVQNHPDDKEGILNLALAYSEKLRTDDAAMRVYEKALAITPHNAPVRMAVGRAHAAAGRFAGALEEFRQALGVDPKIEEKLCDELRALIATTPDRPDVRWFLVNILIDRGYLKEALEQLDAIFEADPAQIKTILQALDRILAKDPGNFAGNLQKGAMLKAQGRFEEARVFLERAHNQNTKNAEAASELEDLYDHILQETDDVGIRFLLGKLNYTQGDYDKAIGHFQKTGQDFRYENESIKMLGLCFVGKGMLEFALQEFRKLVIDEEMKEILYDLAQRYEAKNDVVGAKQVYRQLFAADINYKNVKSKFEMLAGSTSDPMTLEKTSLMTQLSEKARRRYELVEELGRGAMGIVYKARDNELDEFVALKIMPDNLSQNPEAVQRFKSEARSARRLAHPNIVRIHDIGEEMGRKYISMEFVEGTDLKKYMRTKGRLSVQEVLNFGIQIANALDYAHSMSIVHRDIKPANMMLNEKSQVKVSDFGIAKMLEITSETVAGAIIGTPLYMSPEQIQGLPIDNRSDIYSLGVMLYELASGQPPFTTGDLAYQHTKVPAKPLLDIPPALNAIIMKCLEKEKEDRWSAAGELAKALEASGLLARA